MNRPSESDANSLRVFAHDLRHLIRHQRPTPTRPPVPDNAQAHDTVVLCGWTGDWRHSLYHLHILCSEIFTYISWLICLCKSTKTYSWSFLWQRTKLHFVFSGLNCDANIVNFFLLDRACSTDDMENSCWDCWPLSQPSSIRPKLFLSIAQSYSVIQVVRK